MQFSLDNQTDYTINLKLLEQIALTVSSKDIELVISHNNYIQDINLQFRQKDLPTDVLSFPYEDMPMMPLGSIVISVDFVNEKAEQYKHTFEEELALLFIHGVLHLVGYDHEIDNGEHRMKEEELIKQFNLPDSLIVREEESK
ncbi:MAG: rRNA maturation RNase YbeY [Arcobacteraceae bacterium]|nr:rRNA maturation RNase YbeY [Arcobacteraceae bacterium]